MDRDIEDVWNIHPEKVARLKWFDGEKGIAGERSSTIVFPFPINLMEAWAPQGSARG